MLEKYLFYIVFVSQIILISYYYPRQILKRIKYVFNTYSPSEYPKLYPKSIEFYKKLTGYFKIGNNIILILGFLFLIGIGSSGFYTHWKRIEIFSLVYFFVQMFPIFLVEVFGFSYFKLMRKIDIQSVRKAELKPRTLFDYVSPFLVIVAVFSNLFCIVFFYKLHGFQYHLSNDTIVIIVTLILSNGLYTAIIYWNLYGKKIDPHISTKDRANQIETTIKSLVFMSIGASIFIMINEGINQYNLNFFEPVMMSLYLQFVIFIGLGYMLRKYKIENIDFEVYKEDVLIN